MSSTLASEHPGGFVTERDRYFERAAAATGLSDFGADDYSEGLDLFLESLDRDLAISPAGRIATTAQIGLFLASRLHSEEGWKRRPDALQRPITRPMVITGIVRSGTTALHRLMSIDPQFQGLQHWLTRAPQPRPPRERWGEIAAYREVAEIMVAMIAQAPEMEADHMMSAEGVEESIFLLAQGFANNMFPSMWNIPAYDAWYRRQDETASYARLARNLQLIGADAGGRRWLLKNPTDLLAMHAVLNVFPDAIIVQTHRDPLQAIPSVCNLMYAARRMCEGPQCDPFALGMRETEFWAEALERAEAARHRNREPVFDLEFNDFLLDPLGTVKAIYAHFTLVLDAQVEASMRRWLDANPRRSHTLQRFAPEDFGVAADALKARYARYRLARGYA